MKSPRIVFREAHPEFGDDQFDEVILRLQLMF